MYTHAVVSLIALIAVLLTGNNVKYAQTRLPSLLPRSSFVSLRRRLVENRLSWTRRRFATFQRSRRVSPASRSFFFFFSFFLLFFRKSHPDRRFDENDRMEFSKREPRNRSSRSPW